MNRGEKGLAMARYAIENDRLPVYGLEPKGIKKLSGCNRIALFIPIEPRGQARARHMTTKSGISITYKSKEQKTDESKLAAYFIDASQGRRLRGPLRLQLIARMPIPASWPKNRKAAALGGKEWPEKKPDLSNVIKNIEDVAQGIIFDDDKSICQILSSKVYSELCGYEIIIETIDKPEKEVE